MADVLSAVVITLAAALVIWNQVEARLLTPSRRPHMEDVRGVRLDAARIRHVKGDAAADIALIEFTDYECPYCGQFARDVEPAVEAKLVATGAMRHVVINFPLEQLHPNARRAGEAAECAGRQGRYWEMYTRLFHDQRALGAEDLSKSSKALGLDDAVFAQCLAGQVRAQVSADVDEGRKLAITGTPTFFLGRVRPDGGIDVVRRFNGVISVDELQASVSQLRKRTSG